MRILHIRAILAERKRRVRLFEEINSNARKLANRTMKKAGTSISAQLSSAHTAWIKAIAVKDSEGALCIGEDFVIYIDAEDSEDPEVKHFVRARLKDFSTLQLRGLNEDLKEQLRDARPLNRLNRRQRPRSA